MAISIGSMYTQLANHQIWNYGTNCYMYFQVFAYCTQDTTNRKSTVYTKARIYVDNRNTGYSGYSVTQTWGCGITGAIDTSWTGTIKDGGAGAKTEVVINSGSFTVNYASNGTATAKVYYWFNGNTTGRIDHSNDGVEISLPSISASKPAAGNASTIKYSTTSTASSITISLSGGTPGSGASVSGYRIKWNGASSFTGVSNPVTYSDLTPNTKYSFNIDFVDNYGTASSNSISGSATTLSSTPTKGTISASSIKDTSAIISWSGFNFIQGSTWGKYQYKINNGSWVDCLTDQSLVLKNLSPSTTYTIYVRLVNNYGTASDSASISFTTKEKNKWGFGVAYYKTSSGWKRGNLHFKNGSTWIRTYNKLFIKKS